MTIHSHNKCFSAYNVQCNQFRARKKCIRQKSYFQRDCYLVAGVCLCVCMCVCAHMCACEDIGINQYKLGIK